MLEAKTGMLLFVYYFYLICFTFNGNGRNQISLTKILGCCRKHTAVQRALKILVQCWAF